MPLEVAAHRYVAWLAERLAHEAWETLMLDNDIYRRVKPEFHRQRARFVRQVAPTLRVRARQILAGMLAPDSTLPEQQKEEIWEALLLDTTLPRGGNSYQS